MSDDIVAGAAGANDGVTLPAESSASHNAALSPLFINRSGNIGVEIELIASPHGRSGYFWSSTSAVLWGQSGLSLYLTIGDSNSWPSQKWLRSYADPLRCLVSTTNS